MTLEMIIRTIFEIAAIALVITGFIFEKKLIAFENKLMRAIKIHIRNRYIRKMKEEARARATIQKREESEECISGPILTVVEKAHRVA